MTPSYPLRSWTLSGFRAIRDPTVFKLDGLNLLIGSNSAGKSSVLYSILLAAQTLATPLADRPLVLNGALVRLGRASDCVHEETNAGFKLGFELAPEEPPQNLRSAAELGRIRLSAHFAVGDDEDFQLENAVMKAFAADEEAPAQEITMTSRSHDQTVSALREAGLTSAAAEASVPDAGLALGGDAPDGAAGVRSRQFLPESVLVVANAYERELRAFLASTFRLQRRPRPASRSRATQPLSPSLVGLVSDFLREHVGTDAAQVLETDDLTPELLVDRLPSGEIQTLWELPRTQWFHERQNELPFEGTVEIRPLDDLLETGSEFARSWFSRKVRHLGPLRASPRPLYGLPEAASGASVGQSGEYTAAVLSAYGRRQVHAPVPDGSVRQLTLSTAVDYWMESLNLLAAVRSREQGKLGYELQVSIEGVKRDLDLTTVGVGVSQALPIVVLGLIAEPNSLLLFEQPELHLHPDVQAGLGDFFLALARSGRQLIVETHSEYLVNRLRRRQVTATDTEVADLVRLFFFEREGATSRVTAATIGVDGSMPNWPRGFLDTAAREIEAMARDSMT